MGAFGSLYAFTLRALVSSTLRAETWIAEDSPTVGDRVLARCGCQHLLRGWERNRQALRQQQRG